MDPVEQYVKDKFLEYTRRVIIPKIKKYLIVKNISATGEYVKAMEAKALNTAGTIVRIGLYSKRYSKYVEGPRSKFDKGKYINKSGMKRIQQWVEAKHIVMSRYNDGVSIGSNMTSRETAYTIAGSMTKHGRKARYFIDMITEQEMERFKEDIFNNENLDAELSEIKT